MRVMWTPERPEIPSRRLLNDALRLASRFAKELARQGRPRPQAVLLHHDGRRVLKVEEVNEQPG